MPIKKDSLQYYANELGISKKTAHKLGKGGCEQKLRDSKEFEVVSSHNLNDSDIDSSSRVRHFLDAIQDPSSSIHDNEQEFADAIKAIRKQTLIESVVYCHKYVTGELRGGMKDSVRANFCLRFVKNYTKNPSLKPKRKKEIEETSKKPTETSGNQLTP